MEKYSQFRDRGSGVAPFIPIMIPSTTLSMIPRIFIFCLRLIPFLVYTTVYFFILHNLPLPTVFRKLLLWGMLSISGIWWVDLQIDGIKRGRLSEQGTLRIPHEGSVIASSFTSPIDALYLAVVFDPIFAICYPQSRKVRTVSLLRAIYHALSPEQLLNSPDEALSGNKSDTDLGALVSANPNRLIVVFPECVTTNGKAVLPLSPALLTAPATVKTFPVSIRYMPADVTTTIPGAWCAFLWRLLSRPTHCVRVRIGESMPNTYDISTDIGASKSNQDNPKYMNTTATEEQLVLDHLAETMAKIGRITRVSLTVKDKVAFLDAWKQPRKIR